jgi:hypothetical protein
MTGNLALLRYENGRAGEGLHILMAWKGLSGIIAD